MQFKQPSGGMNSENFIKLKDKEFIVGVFKGEPHDFRQHWVNNRSEPCLGEGCKLCSEKVKATFRFRINFITKDTQGNYTARIIEQGWTMYEQLRLMHEGDYNLENTVVKITRHGTGQQTSYTILPALKATVPPQVAQVALLDVVNLKDETPASQATSQTQQTQDDIPW